MDHHSGGHMDHDMPMDGGGGGMGGMMCSMNMLWNNDVENVCVVFSSWRVRGPFSMLISCLLIMFISIGYASLNTYIRTYDKRLAYTLHHHSQANTHAGGHQQHTDGGRSTGPTGGMTSSLIPPIPPAYGVIESSGAGATRNGLVKLSTHTRVVRAVLYASSVAISFWLMLVAMTYNTYLFSSIVIGSFAGHMLYEPEIDVGAVLASGSGKGLACH